MTSKKFPIKLICILLYGILNSCTNSNSGTANIVIPPAPASVVTNMCDSPKTKIIDYGERSAATTAGLRGAFSDTALQPTTNYPAFVFTDAGSLTLKFMSWDGSKYNLEIIAGGLTTSWVKIVYLSTGRPLVFWTNGATGVYMATRSSTDHSTSSAWTISTIDNVATVVARALEVSVNALDQVGVFYVNSANTSARVVLCSSNCQTASNYSGMGVVANAISLTASASNNSADIKWCNAGSGIYYPLVTYGGTAQSLIGRCAQSTLANCLTPANWSTATITDGANTTGANQVMTKLHIGSAAGEAFSVVARRTGTEIRAYRQNAGDCATGGLSFSATSRQIVASATIGNSFGQLLRDSSDRWHLIANDGTTSMRYYNQTTGVITSPWNTGLLETTTLPAIATMRGGAVVDESSDQLLWTYGRSNAGTPTQTMSNVVLGFSNCPVTGAGCSATTLGSAANAAGYSFGNIPLDVSGQIQLTTAQLPNVISLKTTSTGVPAVAFIDFSNGSATTGRLKYRIQIANGATTSWLLSDIGTAVSPHNVSLAFDHLDRPWVAYYDANSLRYFLLTNSKTDGSAAWTQYQFPIAAATAATLPASNNVALTMYENAGVKKPIMVVLNSGAATKVVRAARFDPATETWSNNTLVDSSATNNFGRLTIDSDSLGNIVLAYNDTTNTSIKFTASTDGGATWLSAPTVPAIISGVGGQGLEVRINPLTNRPAISFYDRASNQVRYKYCTTAIATCASSGNWTDLGTGIIESFSGVLGLTAAATDGLLSSSLTFTAEGYPWAVYSLGAGSVSGNLMFNFTNNVLPSFGTPLILNSGYNSNTVAPVAATAANFAVGGWSVSSVRSFVTGSLHSAYVGPGNYLYVTSCGN
jgi:anti-sigma-K factor RskA